MQPTLVLTPVRAPTLPLVYLHGDASLVTELQGALVNRLPGPFEGRDALLSVLRPAGKRCA